MKILFTGGSSFSGLWFVNELVNAGHEVTCALRQKSYGGLRKKRVEQLQATLYYECPFGSEPFLRLVRAHSWDLYCHHAADVTDYKSPDFDVVAALANNTHNLRKVIPHFPKILLTCSIFEQQEGEAAVSPYGLSKGLTTDVFSYYCQQLSKFVIPNPFGPFEEMRYTSFLAKEWLERRTPQVKTPDYVRDNIPISLLAKAYSHFAENLYPKSKPSFYAESQKAFTARFAQEMTKRLQIPCPFESTTQTEFPEPKVRINNEKLDPLALQWNEAKAWDDLAHYYQATFR